MKALNHYLKEMVECFIPECQKFLIFSACKGVDFFSKDYIERGVLRYSKEEYWREEIMRALHLSQDQRTTLLTYKPTIIKEKQKYDELVHKFYETKKELTEQAKNLEIVFDNFRGFLSPRQLAKILVNIEKNKYRKEMNLESMDSFWSYVTLLVPRTSNAARMCPVGRASLLPRLRLGVDQLTLISHSH